MAVYNIKLDTSTKEFSFTKDGADFECLRATMSVGEDRDWDNKEIEYCQVSYDMELENDVKVSKVISCCNEEIEETEVKDFSPTTEAKRIFASARAVAKIQKKK